MSDLKDIDVDPKSAYLDLGFIEYAQGEEDYRNVEKLEVSWAKGPDNVYLDSLICYLDKKLGRRFYLQMERSLWISFFKYIIHYFVKQEYKLSAHDKAELIKLITQL
jgi:hypothetical protein